MHLVLLGPPGAGKGTQAGKLESAYNLPHISTGDMFRRAINQETALGTKAKEYMDQGKLVPDEIVNGIVKERLAEDDCQAGFILDGFPRTVNQAEELTAILEDLDLDLNAVINIEVGEEEVVARLSARRVCEDCGAAYHLKFDPPQKEGICDQCGGSLYQRDDDQPETIKERLAVYQEQTAPLVDYYQDRDLLVTVNGEQEIEEVFADIKAALEALQ